MAAGGHGADETAGLETAGELLGLEGGAGAGEVEALVETPVGLSGGESGDLFGGLSS